MKYIISESKLDQIISDYLDELFPLDNTHHTNPIDEDEVTGEEYEDDTRIEFYLGDYDEENTIFRWYDSKYFYEGSSMQERSPMVIVESPYDKILTGIFNDEWKKPFKKWFNENFELPVKTVMGDSYPNS